ncbi:MAG: hypothetical protein JXX14_00900 [Deltaproteobacteria bacterium]|nr:hypothetical protein [Deltaproteobacteria bacterium]
MRRVGKKVTAFVLMSCCVASVVILIATRAAATNDASGGVSHLCLGDMDINLGLPEESRSIWAGEGESLRLKGCTYPLYDFETSQWGERFLVAGSDNGEYALVAYLNHLSPQKAIEKAASSLKQKGYRKISSDRLNWGVQPMTVFYGNHTQVQLIAVSYPNDRSLLIAVKTSV